MAWKPIVVGVDRTPAAMSAAELAWKLARAADAPLHLVNVTREVMVPATSGGPLAGRLEISRAIQDASYRRTQVVLRRGLPTQLVERLQIRVGRPEVVLAEMARELDVEMLVLGNEHHRGLARWIGGTTTHHLAHVVEVPVLLTSHAPATIRRVLAVVDLADGTTHSLELAARVARLFDASVKVMFLREHASSTTGPSAQNDQVTSPGQFTDVLVEAGWPSSAPSATDWVVREGASLNTIRKETRDWDADMVVVGSSERGWTHRIPLADDLLDDLPTSLLIAPSNRVATAVDLPGTGGEYRPLRALRRL